MSKIDAQILHAQISIHPRLLCNQKKTSILHGLYKTFSNINLQIQIQKDKKALLWNDEGQELLGNNNTNFYSKFPLCVLCVPFEPSQLLYTKIPGTHIWDLIS